MGEVGQIRDSLQVALQLRRPHPMVQPTAAPLHTMVRNPATVAAVSRQLAPPGAERKR